MLLESLNLFSAVFETHAHTHQWRNTLEQTIRRKQTDRTIIAARLVSPWRPILPSASISRSALAPSLESRIAAIYTAVAAASPCVHFEKALGSCLRCFALSGESAVVAGVRERARARQKEVRKIRQRESKADILSSALFPRARCYYIYCCCCALLILFSVGLAFVFFFLRGLESRINNKHWAEVLVCRIGRKYREGLGGERLSRFVFGIAFTWLPSFWILFDIFIYVFSRFQCRKKKMKALKKYSTTCRAYKL